MLSLRTVVRVGGSLVVLAVVAAPSPAIVAGNPLVTANSNTATAGVLHGGVLSISLVAERSRWRFAAGHAPMTVEAFAESGRAPLMPGPFIRVPRGTQLHIAVHNTLPVTVTFLVPAAMHGGADRLDAMDSVIVAAGASATVRTTAGAAGSYVYRGRTTDGVSKVSNIAGMLAGAIVVDSTATAAPPRDRVFVIMATEDSISAVCDDSATVNPLSECPARRFIYTINGRQWPNTDRILATAGDSLHWRVINASFQVHPMHLHGFYYRVDQLSGPLVTQVRPAPGQLVVTQLLSPLAAMSMTWSPARAGNWLFHCHFALHNASYALLGPAGDQAMRDMVGLVIGTIVARHDGAAVAHFVTPARQVRLIAESEPSSAGRRATMRFVIDDHGRRVATSSDVSPELDLVRGAPVAITIVNHLAEPTTVHWHGIEVQDSYADGAAGFSGDGRHISPAIAPGDSFTARFTPTRSGSFLYHAHMDEMRQELAGLAGVLIVRDAAGAAAANDHAFLFKGDAPASDHPFEINGQRDPDTVVVHVGERVRLRLLNLATSAGAASPVFALTFRSDSAATLVRDSMLVRWEPLAKDGFDLPAAARSSRPAQEVVSVGETFDFAFSPATRGMLQLEVRAVSRQHQLYARVPVRVE